MGVGGDEGSGVGVFVGVGKGMLDAALGPVTVLGVAVAVGVAVGVGDGVAVGVLVGVGVFVGSGVAVGSGSSPHAPRRRATMMSAPTRDAAFMLWENFAQFKRRVAVGIVNNTILPRPQPLWIPAFAGMTVVQRPHFAGMAVSEGFA